MLQINSWITPSTMPTPPANDTIHIWKIGLTSPEATHLQLLSDDEKQRRDNLLDERDQLRFSNARTSLRIILSGYLGVSPQSIRLNYGVKGKPELNPLTTIQFNLSHAGDMALLAISSGLPIGIDLEQLQYRDNLRKIAKRVFEQEQWLVLKDLDDKSFISAFFIQWTELEAKAKATGDGVFSRHDKHLRIPCIHFQPEADWCAALAGVGHLPKPEAWIPLRFTPELNTQIG